MTGGYALCMATMTAADVLGELAALEDPKARALNERHGDAHGVNLTKLRAVAKKAGTDAGLARELWSSDDVPGQLVALLIVKPRALDPDEVDRMLRSTRSAKAHDWLVNYIAKKHPASAAMRERWIDDASPDARAAGWALTTQQVSKGERQDLDELLDRIESELRDAPAREQWAMNETLANIGIFSPEHRARALEIGERLQVLADYPTSPGCTSPFAPAWIGEMVRRREG